MGRILDICNKQQTAFSSSYTKTQRRRSGSKSGGRESGRRNFRFQSKKNSIFQAKFLTTFFSRQLKKLSLSLNIHLFIFSTYILG